jgi:hypothetical protein
MRYRIVEEPRLGHSPVYKVQSKGCGPLALFWHSQKRYSPYGASTRYHATLPAAEEAMEDLRRYDKSRNQVVREVGCKGEDIL